MPSRSHLNALARLLNSVARPLYVVDAQWQIIFCNETCEHWIGVPRDELIGARCRYHSGETRSPAEAIAASLCPPPAAMTGRAVAATLSIATAEGKSSSRRAQFIPLEEQDGDGSGVLVLVATEEQSPDESEESPDDLEALALHDRLARHHRRMEAKYRVDSLLGISPAITRVRAQIQLAAGSNVHVTLNGPPGSGRQHVARTIHYAARGKQSAPLVPLACSLIGVDLLNTTITALMHSEEHATEGHRPALLLGDAERLPTDAQAALAERMAAGRMPLRIMSTTREALIARAARGDFREDLACALSTISIELPPLADRLEDLPLLAQAFLEKSNAAGEKQLGGFTSRALDRLAAYAWPAGLDELAEVIGQSHGAAEGPDVTADDLPRHVRLSADAAAAVRQAEEPIVLEEFLGRIETELIQRALRRAKGNKTKAAALLGMNRPRFYRRLVQLGLVDV